MSTLGIIFLGIVITAFINALIFKWVLGKF
jgi:hypothetical protein